MCGIAGYLLRAPSHDTRRNIAALMNSIRQRGPDDEGVCLISRSNNAAKYYHTERTTPSLRRVLEPLGDGPSNTRHDLGLVHTRYSIIDLTSGGHQPLVTSDGSVVLIFNGEIYNYHELRIELSSLGVSFRTASDTEVLIEGYRLWGHQVWSRLNGFWAVALYDFRTRSFSLCRDRLGVASLYYRETSEGLYFASSIQSLVDVEPDTVVADEDRVVGFIQTALKDCDNSTFYHQVKSVAPGTVLTLGRPAYRIEDSESLQYWALPSSRLTPSDLSFDDAVASYRDTFLDAVGKRLRADVKVAFELSGGLDSSSIVAAAAVLKKTDITTFTIQVPEEDEEPYARSMLERYPGIDYRVLSDAENSFLYDMDAFSRIMQEPFHSPNIYTHFKMRRKMKDAGVSVVLSGSGGDEVLAGYESEFWPQAAADLRRNGSLWQASSYLLANRNRQWGWQRAAYRGARSLIYRGARRLRELLRPSADCTDRSTRYSNEAVTDAERYRQRYPRLSFHEQVLFHFTVGLLPYYLRSNDHFCMAIPIEQRLPFLDYRMVELGLRMPVGYLFRDGWTKYILRKAMEPYLPKTIVWRKAKMGFPFPYRRFLSQHRAQFEPMVRRLGSFWVRDGEVRDYDEILKKDPVKLWRLCSTALWLEGPGRRVHQ